MKAIILDMYGVIIKQTGDDFVPYVQRFFPDLRAEEIEKTWFQADLGEISSLEVWARLGFRGNLEAVEKEYLDTLELNRGFHDFAAAAGKQYKLAILSNDSSRWSRYIREKFAMDPYFDVINISGDLKRKKPDRRVYELTAEQLGVETSDCVYIDDRRKNLGAAREVGMDTILFNSRNVAYEGKMVKNFYELAEIFALSEFQVRFRKIVKEEFDALKCLFPEDDKVWESYRSRRLEQFDRGDADIYVITRNGAYIGEISVNYSSRTLPGEAIPGKRAYFEAFRVEEQYQNLGLGQRLLRFALDDLERKGFTEFTIGVEDTNDNARHIYFKAGFTMPIDRRHGEDDSCEYTLYLRKQM